MQQSGGSNLPQTQTQTQTTRRPTTPVSQQSNVWYFYNPQAVSQGKQRFEQQWGKRPNADNWQRSNLTVLKLDQDEEQQEEQETGLDGTESTDSITSSQQADSVATEASDPHTREYYLAQIPFTEEQKQASDAIIMESLLEGWHHPQRQTR